MSNLRALTKHALFALYLHASLAHLLVHTMTDYLHEKSAWMKVSCMKRPHDSGVCSRHLTQAGLDVPAMLPSSFLCIPARTIKCDLVTGDAG